MYVYCMCRMYASMYVQRKSRSSPEVLLANEYNKFESIDAIAAVLRSCGFTQIETHPISTETCTQVLTALVKSIPTTNFLHTTQIYRHT
jgi:hypothetical protein